MPFRVRKPNVYKKSPFEIQIRSKNMIKHEFLDSCWVQQYSGFCLLALTLMTADLSKKNNFFLSIKDWVFFLFSDSSHYSFFYFTCLYWQEAFNVLQANLDLRSGQNISSSVGFTKTRAFPNKSGQNCANLLCRNNISQPTPEKNRKK